MIARSEPNETPQMRRGPTPLYLQLESILREQIDRGDLAPGDALPSEQELMNLYSVSRNTVRQALGQLAEDEVIVKVQGKGTYVSQTEIKQGLDALRTLSEVLTGVGLVPEVRVLDVHMNPDVPAHVRRQLELESDEAVVRVKRQHLVQGEPVAFAVIYLSGRFPWRFSVDDLKRESIYSWLEEQQSVTVHSGFQVIKAKAATEEVADALGLQLGDPVLHVENTATSETGVAIDHTEFYFPPERYALTVTLRRNHTGIALENVEASWP
jgi:GntR family transcriptional regulator